MAMCFSARWLRLLNAAQAKFPVKNAPFEPRNLAIAFLIVCSVFAVLNRGQPHNAQCPQRVTSGHWPHPKFSLLCGVERTLSLRTSAPHPKAVGRPLIWAEKGLEMRPVGTPPCPDDAGKIAPHPAPPFPYIFRTTVVARRRSRVKSLKRRGVPNGIRTRVATLKEWSPRPLDDGDGGGLCGIRPVP